jgi:hypothetical protein
MTENPLHSRVLLHDSTMLGRLAVDADAFATLEKWIRRELRILEVRWADFAAPPWKKLPPLHRVGGSVTPPETPAE